MTARAMTSRHLDATAATDSQAVHTLLERLAPPSKTPGLQLVVVDRTGIVFEHRHGLAELISRRPMLSDSSLMAYSMSKTITAAAVLQLVGIDAIAIDDPISRYLPWQPYGKEITVRQLLSHTSGIPNPVPLRWVHLVDDHARFDERSALDLVLSKHSRPAASPGARFAYSNIGYWLLGPLITAVTGEPFTTHVTTHVLSPLGIVSSELAYAIIDPPSHASGYLARYSFMNLFKRLLIDRAFIGEYTGRWLRIRDHYVNGPAFGGVVGTAFGFGKFLRDQLAEGSRLFGDKARHLFYEQQSTLRSPIPMTLGWHIGSTNGARYYYKEGGGGGFHCMMRLYPARAFGMVVMCNATQFDVAGLLDHVASSYGVTTP